MPVAEVRSAQQALTDAAWGLVAEWADLPAGSVLRCYSRAVLRVRRAGTPSEAVAEEAVRLARGLLAARGRSDRSFPGVPEGLLARQAARVVPA